MAKSLLLEMRALPKLRSPMKRRELQVTLLIPAKNSASSLEHTVTEAYRFLQERYPDDFEMILIPNPSPDQPEDKSLEVAENLSRRFAGVRVVPHLGVSGKGAALRTGFAEARGRWIFFTDADLPYDLEFFDRAASLLRKGVSFVTGNRRLQVSEFDIPVSLLPVANKRHRLGMLFNKVARTLMPLGTSDTQAGIKAMSQEMAEAAFRLQTCPGFFFDIEFFLASHRNKLSHAELPVTLFLNSEKSTVRILRESLLAGYWLLRIMLRNWKGAYRFHLEELAQ